MLRLALLVSVVLFATAPAWAASDPLSQDRKALAECLERTASDDKLIRISTCVGLIAEKCADAPDATTISIVDCHDRERQIWDQWLNSYYGKAQAKLKDSTGAATALKEAQRAWIAYRDAKCGVWAKFYEGGTIASIAVSGCLRETTGARAIEMRIIADEVGN